MVVIVDDNSGSMSGKRLVECIKKTTTLIEACIQSGISYQYATFGSSATQRGSCEVRDVAKFLTAREGTTLIQLTNAALDATDILTAKKHHDDVFRMIYVLNTDGEASDGQRAGEKFIEGYNRLRNRFPSMQEPRSFVLGIGKDHDQKILGAMSVGESSYFNYADDSLESMSIDAKLRIIPELSGSKTSITMTLSSGDTIKSYVEDGLIRLDGMKICNDESFLTVGDITIPLTRHTIDETSQEYFEAQLKGIELEAMYLLKEIKNKLSLSQNISEQEEIEKKITELKNLLDNLKTDDNSAGVAMLADIIQDSSDETGRAHEVWRARAYAAVRSQMKQRRGVTLDRRAAVGRVVSLCQSGLQSLRLGGTLSRELERDYMEVLGVGGFQHWSSKKQQRVVDRALAQANAESVTEADLKAWKLRQKAVTVDVHNPVISDSYGNSSVCWLTLLSGIELFLEADVLCVAGYISRGDRNLPLCSVSSAKVLDRAVLAGRLRVCPQPMSFLTLRQLLLEGHEIAKGPNGAPINACISLLPTSHNISSAKIANCYSGICYSQLLTSRWVYTQGTAEYRNGALAALMAIAVEGTREADLSLLAAAIDGFYHTFAGTPYMEQLLVRARGVAAGEATSGEVPTALLLLADQMLLATHCRITEGSPPPLPAMQFYRTLLLRLLRDKMDDLFTAFCSAADPEADAKRRQKEIDADAFVELLVQGVHIVVAEDEDSEGAADVRGLLNTFSSEEYFQHQHRPAASMVDSDSFVSLTNYEMERPLEDTAPPPPSAGDAIAAGSEQSLQQAIQAALTAYGLQSNRTPPFPSTEAVLEGLWDPLRRRLCRLVLQSLSHELHAVVNAAAHLQHQCGQRCERMDIWTLLQLDQLLEAEGSTAELWLVSQLVVAVKLRINARYRTAMSSSVDGEHLHINWSPLKVVTNINDTCNKRLQRIVDELRDQKKQLLSKQLLRRYLQLQQPLSGLPFRIGDDEHFRKLNDWTTQRRGFALMRTVSPVDGSYTSMAKNTFLIPHNPFFMESVDPFSVLVMMYGYGEDRLKSNFCEHLHTQSRQIFASCPSYAEFYATLQTHYTPVHKMKDLDASELWVSYVWDSCSNLPLVVVREEMLRRGNFSDDEVGQEQCRRAEAALVQLSDWYADPFRYLDDYFARYSRRNVPRLPAEQLLAGLLDAEFDQTDLDEALASMYRTLQQTD